MIRILLMSMYNVRHSANYKKYDHDVIQRSWNIIGVVQMNRLVLMLILKSRQTAQLAKSSFPRMHHSHNKSSENFSFSSINIWFFFFYVSSTWKLIALIEGVEAIALTFSFMR